MGPWGVGLQGECMNEKAKTAAAQRSNDTETTRLTWRESGTQACTSGARYDFGFGRVGR